MKCQDFREIIDSYLSDELLTETNHEVLRHMESCAKCRSVIEARREVRSHLKSAVLNAPQYQIGKHFTHNLQTQLKHEALKNQATEEKSWFGLGSWATVAVGLVLVVTFGFILLNYSGDSSETTIANTYATNEVPSNHIVNVAFGDHQFCAVKYSSENPVRLAETPAKYESIKQIAMPVLEQSLVNSKLKKSHTCEYKGTKFTHLIVEKEDEILSVMVTDKSKAEKFGEDISYYSTPKYQMARFDVKDSAVFVVSGFDKQTNSKTAEALYKPLQKHLSDNRDIEAIQTALLMFY